MAGFSFHWRCDRIQLFQLGFADNLLLFSKADPNSVHIFKEGLTIFADLSGLQANLHKSHLILSRSAAPHRDTLLTILGFQEGHLPLRYLGLPLLTSRLSVADCQPIIRKIEARIRGWDGIMLSFAGRTSNYSVWTISTRSGTWGWRKLIRLRDSLRPCITYRIGDGTSFSLWHDPWHARSPFISQFPLGPRHTSLPASAPLCMVILEENWNWPHVTNMESVDITHDLPTIHGGPDRILWTGPRGSFSAAAAYTVFCPPGPKVGWSSLLGALSKSLGIALYYGWLSLGDYLQWISHGCNTWAQRVCYARRICRRVMSTCSFCAPMLLCAYVRYGGWSFSIGRITVGPRSSGGHQ
ncbi:UNVERIFIED_CONTAM: hypothetical protein Sradi_3619400 [Sesamum radiatum]|uniref:Reverse transcriptase domain-containing protein n=1 Tax=Sesamum radiatum TaxID=300843 RepID=A0AAW2QHG1_SESRA